MAACAAVVRVRRELGAVRGAARLVSGAGRDAAVFAQLSGVHADNCVARADDKESRNEHRDHRATDGAWATMVNFHYFTQRQIEAVLASDVV